ncbi:hypothetical protein [Eoetvoesiella caeni]|uniref:Uncharacterized protein n=1 Tax=Eoetvoesiella caeni TaxID=645616 RepID=A0A366HC03_9BURK|nr:hypothetical protein [Eoetvoesiella caeni]MCI2809363.1 hypothetical protein [Eoetvoesiella caeni]NYT54504.1 hypothetical protein [Eoetvoesiella caeni]RBP39307.1 hypothetical protein DFR37_10599 [Eoetvoesiella caeni]
MTQHNLSFVTGRQLRDAGMHTAIGHAAATHDDWPEQAFEALQTYVATHPGKEFMAEDVRNYAYDVLAIPYPPHCRAWGSIIARAAREGMIRRVGIGPVKTASSHMANASVWRAA